MRFWSFLCALILIIWFALPTPAWGVEREHFQVITGFSYLEGDFGTGSSSKTVFMPFTFRYLGERFDLGLTIPFVYQDSSAAISIIDGRPIRIRDDPVSNIIDLLAPGVGDLALKGRLYLFDDPGTDSFCPAYHLPRGSSFPRRTRPKALGQESTTSALA